MNQPCKHLSQLFPGEPDTSCEVAAHLPGHPRAETLWNSYPCAGHKTTASIMKGTNICVLHSSSHQTQKQSCSCFSAIYLTNIELLLRYKHMLRAGGKMMRKSRCGPWPHGLYLPLGEPDTKKEKKKEKRFFDKHKYNGFKRRFYGKKVEEAATEEFELVWELESFLRKDMPPDIWRLSAS